MVTKKEGAVSRLHSQTQTYIFTAEYCTLGRIIMGPSGLMPTADLVIQTVRMRNMKTGRLFLKLKSIWGGIEFG